jgi:hypothetical protein
LEKLTGPKAANRLNKILETISIAHQVDRFPIDVPQIALSCHEVFGWSDPISSVQVADLPGFEGCLYPNESRTKWLMLYNSNISALGRVRFTQAHELGHYALHRFSQNAFQCADSSNMHSISDEAKSLEQQADEFASFLLMPLDDFRRQITCPVSLDIISHCAHRYGVSLTAAAIKWLSQTEEKAVLVVSNDGYINWAWSSDAARKAGAFFRPRQQIIEVPSGSLAANDEVLNERIGKQISIRTWFPHADPGLLLSEMKVTSEQYGNVLTLLVLPSITDVWPPWVDRDRSS